MVARVSTLPAARSRADEIRGAALSLFATLGYRATTMADIGAAVGIRGPSIYKHVPSKHELLVTIMLDTMDRLLAAQRAALASSSDPVEQLRAAVHAHVRHHALHRHETFVGNREIDNLDPTPRGQVLRRRARYERALRSAISNGIESGVFATPSAQLASFAILDMGMGVSAWYDPAGSYSPEQLGELYAGHALRMLGARAGIDTGRPTPT